MFFFLSKGSIKSALHGDNQTCFGFNGDLLGCIFEGVLSKVYESFSVIVPRTIIT